MEEWLVNVSAVQKLLYAGGGGGVGVGLLFLLKHLTLSGAERQAGEQKRDQSAEARAERWENDYKGCEKKRELNQRKADALAASHDGMIEFAGSGVTPEVVTKHIKLHARAKTIIDAVINETAKS